MRNNIYLQHCVVKCYASRRVNSEKRVNQDAMELFQFFEENFIVRDAYHSNKPMLNRLFFFISSDDTNDFLSSFPENCYKAIKVTLKVHEVTNTPGDGSHIFFRNIACACNNYLYGKYELYEAKDKQFKDVP